MSVVDSSDRINGLRLYRIDADGCEVLVLASDDSTAIAAAEELLSLWSVA